MLQAVKTKQKMFCTGHKKTINKIKISNLVLGNICIILYLFMRQKGGMVNFGPERKMS